MARKKTPIPLCSWCGTKLQALKPGCPRGPQCARDEANSQSLLDRARAKESK